MKAKDITEGLTQHAYTFYIIDPQTGEFTVYGQGAPFKIIQQLEADAENSDIAKVIKQQTNLKADANGIISFVYDSHIYSFIPS